MRVIRQWSLHPAPKQSQLFTEMHARVSTHSCTGPDAKTYILLSLLWELDTKTSKDPEYATKLKFQGK